MAKQKEETTRDTELSGRASIRRKLLDLYRDIEEGFTNQNSRSDDILDYWDAYNCKLGERQFYSGNSKIFVPLVKNAIRARKTRFTNQIFPQSGRFVEVTTTDGTMPYADMSLAEHYIRATKLRTQIVPALIVSGDVEGTYNLYVGWGKRERHVVSRETKPLESDGMVFPELGEVDDVKEETIDDSGPTVEILSDVDVLVLPTTANSPEDALEQGGSVTIIRRWTKGKVKKMRDEGEIDEDAADDLIKAMSTKRQDPDRPDIGKHLTSAIGIKGGSGSKYVSVAEVWTKLKVDGEHRLTRSFIGGPEQILGCKLNPFWCDECPLISAPVDKVGGVFKGRAPLADVLDVQIAANDAMNEGEDTAHFSAMPIIMTDPEKTPNIGSMVLGLAAIWQTNPNDTKFAEFPQLWKDCVERIANAAMIINQTMGVNPAMMPQQTGSRAGKRNQAEIANEQQVDLLTTADSVTNLEEAVLTPLVKRYIAYDHQFREAPILVRQYGELGLRAIMEEVPPQQMDHRYEYRWFGVEAARNAAQVQQQIAGLNVLKGIPPQMYEGYRLNVVPVITQLVENTYGPRLAPLIFQDLKQQLSVSPEMENDLLEQGFDCLVHPMDDDQQHIQSHMVAMRMSGGDLHGTIRAHIIRHQQQMQAKAQVQAQQQQVQGLPGGPGGAGPGVAGTPQPGAQPAVPRLVKGPPGMIAPERMPAAGAVNAPRKF